MLIITWLADSDRNRKLRLCTTDYRKVALNIQGKWPMYFCFLNSFCMWFASNEQSRILIRYQYFFCNRKTRWQLSLYSERHQNVRIYHRKYNTFVPIELLSTSFKIIISMRWNVILINIDVKNHFSKPVTPSLRPFCPICHFQGQYFITPFAL